MTSEREQLFEAVRRDLLSQPKPPDRPGLVVMLAGPIGHWWDENWASDAHVEYVAWREFVNEALVLDGHLVYRPHEAFKGRWQNKAQVLNDAVLMEADVVLNLCPPGVPSPGTDHEVDLARYNGKPVIACPPSASLRPILIKLANGDLS